MFDLCMRRAQSIGRADYVRTDGRMDLAHTFRTDMLHFLIYLIYSDGKVNKEEIKYINQLFGTQFDENMLRDYADRWGLRSESIRDHAPRSLNSFVRSNIGGETGEIPDSRYGRRGTVVPQVGAASRTDTSRSEGTKKRVQYRDGYTDAA